MEKYNFFGRIHAYYYGLGNTSEKGSVLVFIQFILFFIAFYFLEQKTSLDYWQFIPTLYLGVMSVTTSVFCLIYNKAWKFTLLLPYPLVWLFAREK